MAPLALDCLPTRLPVAVCLAARAREHAREGCCNCTCRRCGYTPGHAVPLQLARAACYLTAQCRAQPLGACAGDSDVACRVGAARRHELTSAFGADETPALLLHHGYSQAAMSREKLSPSTSCSEGQLQRRGETCCGLQAGAEKQWRAGTHAALACSPPCFLGSHSRQSLETWRVAFRLRMPCSQRSLGIGPPCTELQRRFLCAAGTKRVPRLSARAGGSSCSGATSGSSRSEQWQQTHSTQMSNPSSLSPTSILNLPLGHEPHPLLVHVLPGQPIVCTARFSSTMAK